jgi:hypothetical protein
MTGSVAIAVGGAHGDAVAIRAGSESARPGWVVAAKLREVDDAMTAEHQTLIFEDKDLANAKSERQMGLK